VLEPEGRINDHGTATCLPLPDEVLELSEPLAPVLLDERRLLLVLEVPLCPVLLASLESEPDVEPLDSTEMTAKSTLPEVGLMITSLIVPRFESPEEALTGALINLLAWISWPPPRPVALKELELPCLLLPSVWLPL